MRIKPEDRILVEELYFLHGIGFKVLLPQNKTEFSSKKGPKKIAKSQSNAYSKRKIYVRQERIRK